MEFGKSGRVYDKQVTIDALAGESVSGASIVPQVTDFSVVALSNEVVLVRYRSVRTTVSDARRRFETLRSSIWKLDSGRWQMVFHQGINHVCSGVFYDGSHHTIARIGVERAQGREGRIFPVLVLSLCE